MRIGIIGRGEMLYDAMAALLARRHEIACIVTSEAYPEDTKKEDDFRQFALAHGIPFLPCEAVNGPDAAAFVAAHAPEIGVSLNCKVMLSPDILRRFPCGIINAHFGDLPRYRGNAVINWAIINGEPRVTCTLHLMNEEIDAGPILLKKDFPISENTYYGEIYSRIAEALPGLFADAVSGVESGALVPKPQSPDASLASRCYPRRLSDSELDFSLAARALARLVRASSEPLAGAFSYYNNQRITVWRASAGPLQTKSFGIPGSIIRRNKKDGTVAVLTGEGELVLEQIEFANSGRRKPAEVLKSLRDRLGFDYRDALKTLEKKISMPEEK